MKTYILEPVLLAVPVERDSGDAGLWKSLEAFGDMLLYSEVLDFVDFVGAAECPEPENWGGKTLTCKIDPEWLLANPDDMEAARNVCFDMLLTHDYRHIRVFARFHQED